MIILSLAIHISPFLFLDHSKFNYYDTDTWYTIRQIQLLNSNQPTNFDPMLAPPSGRTIDWSDFAARIGTLFTNSTETLQIFNSAGFAPILLLVVLALLGCTLAYVFYGKQAVIVALVLLLIPTGRLCSQAMYGIQDHHILECIFGMGTILCLIITLTKSRWFVAPTVLFSILSFFTSRDVFLIFLAMSGVIFFVWMCLQYQGTRRWEYLTSIFCFGITGISIYALGLIPQRYFLFFTYVDPIAELAPISPLSFLIDFNFLLVLVVIALYHNRRKTQTLLLGVSCVILTILSFKFSRCEVLLYPFVAILASKCVDTKITRVFLCLFIAIALILSALAVTSIYQVSDRYSDFNPSLKYLHDKPDGIVLAWWDYGHWILTASNKSPLSDPFQANAVLTSEIFTGSNKSHALDLIKEYNISYILVSSEDVGNYYSMRFYYNGGDYEESMLKRWIDNRDNAEFHSGEVSIFNTTPLGLSLI